MPYDQYDVVDCDGHIVETVDELAKFMDPATRKHALEPARNREGVFPSLDGFHLALHTGAAVRERVTASDHRPESAADWLAFLDKAKLDRAVLFTSEGLSVGNIQNPRYAAAVCRAYNDYVHDMYARVSDRLRPIALIPMQDPEAAADYVFGAFADGSDPFTQSNLTGVQGTATYEGEATGVYSAEIAGSTGIGYFDSDVALTADFGDGNDLGTIRGSMTNFEVDGEATDGRLDLGTANIGSQNSGFFKGSVTGSVTGTDADVERSYTGQWGGQFFGNEETDGKPGSVAGTFGGNSSDDSVNFVGVFGAHKQ